jgi:hypothetical protein
LAQAAAARSAPTAPHSTTRIASYSCKKFIKPSVSRRSPQLETESIYETRSRYNQFRKPLERYAATESVAARRCQKYHPRRRRARESRTRRIAATSLPRPPLTLVSRCEIGFKQRQ